MSRELHLELEVTAEDRKAFRRRVGQQLRAATADLRGRSRLWSIPTFVLIGLAIALAASWLRIPTATLVGLLIISIGFAALVGILQWQYVRDQTELMHADADARTPRRLILDFGPEGVRYQTAQSEGRANWSMIVGLDETPEHVFVMHSIGQGWVLPRRLLSAEQLETLRALVREHAAPGARGAS